MEILLERPRDERDAEEDHDVIGRVERTTAHAEDRAGEGRGAKGEECRFHGNAGWGRGAPSGENRAPRPGFRGKYTPETRAALRIGCAGRCACLAVGAGRATLAAMSRAFTREDDARDALLPKRVSPLPPGTRNLLTPAGAARLRAELTGLLDQERPRLIAAAAEEGGRGADAKEELQRADLRIAYLEQCLATADLVPPPPPPHEAVRFGATVTVRDAKGAESRYRIVGVDEADFARDEVSWLSPIARALLNARLGERVPFRFPSGQTTLEIVAIGYE